MATSYTYNKRDMENILSNNGFVRVKNCKNRKVYTNGIRTVSINATRVSKLEALRVLKQCGLY